MVTRNKFIEFPLRFAFGPSKMQNEHTHECTFLIGVRLGVPTTKFEVESRFNIARGILKIDLR